MYIQSGYFDRVTSMLTLEISFITQNDSPQAPYPVKATQQPLSITCPFKRTTIFLKNNNALSWTDIYPTKLLFFTQTAILDASTAEAKVMANAIIPQITSINIPYVLILNQLKMTVKIN